MKRLFIIAAISGVALAGCTKNEVVPSASEQQEITFANPVSHVVTKVDLVPTTYPTTSSFSVFADYHKLAYNTVGVTYTPYMRGSEGVDVTHSTEVIGTAPDPVYNSYWTSSKPYYWPKDGYLTFAAYSPASTKGDAAITYDITNGVKITGYVVKTDRTNQRDLMLSNREVDETSAKMVTNNPDPYDGVQLTFNHVLSAIDFTVKTADDYAADNYTITLTSITIQNAFTTGTLTQFADAATVNIDLTAIWSDQQTEGNYVVPNISDKVITSVETAITPDANIADLVLLPQRLAHTETGESGNKVQAVVAYTVSHPDMGTGVSVPYTASLDLSGVTGGKWEAGTRYTYNISIGMDKVIFAPVVTGWADGGSVDL